MIAACGPQRPALRPARKARLRTRRALSTRPDRIDVLFVSSAHLSNVFGPALVSRRGARAPPPRSPRGRCRQHLRSRPVAGRAGPALRGPARRPRAPVRRGPDRHPADPGRGGQRRQDLRGARLRQADRRDLPGVPRLDGGEGMVAHDEPEDFAAALEALLAAPDLRASHAAAARAAALRLGRCRALPRGPERGVCAVLGSRAGPRRLPEPIRATRTRRVEAPCSGR